MTRPFLILPLTTNSVTAIRAVWSAIDFQPSYQRQSDLWSRDKQQLFIDSLINGYDIPKLYFHDLSWQRRREGTRYAIIDGKQRLEAINGFMNGEFPLSDDFEDVEQDGLETAGAAAGLTYADLAGEFPALKARLDRAELPIILVQTGGDTPRDLEVIEEMFSRLNEAVPLNAPEKRNALGGPLPRQVRRLVRQEFFISRLGFPNYRYRHLDLATKFLYIEHRRGLSDLKKRDLDSFVKTFKARSLDTEAERLYKSCSLVLDAANAVFIPSDPLLTSVGMVTVYYFLLRAATEEAWVSNVKREALWRFEELRARNRTRAKEVEQLALAGRIPAHTPPVNPVLSQFERYVQSPNDVTALTNRYEVLRRFVIDGTVPSTGEVAGT